MFSDWMLQSKEFNPKNFNTSAITLKLGFKLGFKTRASRGNHGNLTHQGPRGNMHKLFGCISTPLKRFLACLTFHTEEIRLRHLHKRTNTGSAPDIYIYIYVYIIQGSFSLQRGYFFWLWVLHFLFPLYYTVSFLKLLLCLTCSSVMETPKVQ